jgi:hypothetical protein
MGPLSYRVVQVRRHRAHRVLVTLVGDVPVSEGS